MNRAPGANLPRWAPFRWLVGTRQTLPAAVVDAQMKSLYGTLPIYVAAAINTVAVASVLAIRIATPLFIALALFEAVLAVARFRVLILCRRAAQEGRPAPADMYLALSLAWASSLGVAAFFALMSGDWVAAVLACISNAAILGGMCFRYFPAPRLACVMMMCAALPMAAGCVLSGQPVLLLAGLQVPLYVFSMTMGAAGINRSVVATRCAEQQNAYRARHDALTGLLNRGGLTEAVEQRAATAPLTVFFFDLDGFKQVNDTLGHAAGDRLLAMVGDRLRGSAKPGEVLARLGGDEFVLLSDLTDPLEAFARGEQMIAALAGLPYIIDAQGVLIGASVGVALRPVHGITLEDLLATADEALYRAKSGDRCQCVVAGLDEDVGAPPLNPVRRDPCIAAASAA